MTVLEKPVDLLVASALYGGVTPDMDQAVSTEHSSHQFIHPTLLTTGAFLIKNIYLYSGFKNSY